MFNSKKIYRTLLICAVLLSHAAGISVLAQTSDTGSTTVTIISPYKDVDWENFGQFKTALHVHSTNSDGHSITSQVIEEHYAKGYDIVALTDHNYLTKNWEQADKGPMTAERKAEINAGVGRDGRGLIGIDNTTEHSRTDHLNAFFADCTSESGQSPETILAAVESLGGITRLNHPGRYTRAHRPIFDGNADNQGGINISKSPSVVTKYVGLFMSFPSCVGMEIINKLDNESAADRVLWDSILIRTMRYGRPVWGFADDDSHNQEGIGYAWNVMLMSCLEQDNFRNVMETGAFYAVSRVSRLDDINAHLPDGGRTPSWGRASTEFMLSQSTPSIVNIVVDEKSGSITITGADYDVIEWIADGEVIASGKTLSLHDHREKINNYVRAQLKSSTGIAFTQPFGIRTTSSR